jgi:hypothetical protein
MFTDRKMRAGLTADRHDLFTDQIKMAGMAVGNRLLVADLPVGGAAGRC